MLNITANTFSNTLLRYQAGNVLAYSGYLSGGTADSVDSLLPFGEADGTAQLAQALKSKILPTATVLTQATDTKTALQQSPSPRILVLATYGFFVPNSEKEIVQPGDLGTNNTSIQTRIVELRVGVKKRSPPTGALAHLIRLQWVHQVLQWYSSRG